jgi:hypothetical protein
MLKVLEQSCCDDVPLEQAPSGRGPMPEWHGEQIVETTTEARQGVTGHNVRYVLVWGTVGVIVAFVIVYFLFFR